MSEKFVNINEIYPFENNPYSVKDNEEMDLLIESIKQYGVMEPLIVRKREKGGFEIVSGHRRKYACEKAGIEQVPVLIRDMDKNLAIITLVDSNLQRSDILPSEKAFAFKMKLEAMKKQGQRNDLTSAPTEQKLQGKTTREIIAEEMGESSSNIQRFVRLTELIPELLKIVDEGKMKLRPAVELSYLKKEEQQEVFDAIEYTDAFPSHPQAIKMRKLSESGKLTMEEIDNILDEEKPNQIPKFKIPEDKVDKYIPDEYKSQEEKQDYIVHCVKKVAELEKQKQKKYEYER